MSASFVYNRQGAERTTFDIGRTTQVIKASSDSPGWQTIRSSRDALLQRAADEPDLGWRVLATLNAFRLLIAAALLVLFLAGGEQRIFGDRYPVVFWITATAYFAFAAASAYSLRSRWLSAGSQAVLQTLVDIVAIVTLMHASGGISSGLGGL